MTAARLLWAAAGRPLIAAEMEPYQGPCWWCGLPSDGHGRPIQSRRGCKVAALPDTFTDGPWAACKAASHICEACAWTMCDWVLVPESERLSTLSRALSGEEEGAGKSSGNLRGTAEKIRITPTGDLLRVATVKGEALGDWTAADLSARLTTKFRNWDHAAVGGQWRIGKAVRPSDREWMRDLVLSPPDGDWCLVIGDGQKHAAIKAIVSDGYADDQTVCIEGQVVTYTPADLARLIEAVERLRIAGFRDEDIERGAIIASDPARLSVARSEGPIVSPWATSPTLNLALRLARRAKEITDGYRPPAFRGGPPDRPLDAPRLPVEPVLPVRIEPADAPPSPVERPGPVGDRGAGPKVGAQSVGPVESPKPARPRQLSLFG